MKARCLKVEYQKANIFLTVNFGDRNIKIEFSEKFKKSYEFLADKQLYLTKNVRAAIITNMPKYIGIIKKERYEIDLLHILPWANDVIYTIIKRRL